MVTWVRIGTRNWEQPLGQRREKERQDSKKASKGEAIEC
jgi:hypothetical protein